MDKLKTGEMIRQARMKKGYTQNELGMLLGVTNKAISRWENGDSFPDVGVLEQLSNTLELNIQDIVTGKTGGSCDEAVSEIARAAKIQEKERRSRIVVLGMGSLLLVLLLLIGFRTFNGYPVFSTVYYFYFMAVILVMISFKCIYDDYLANPFQRKTSKRSMILSTATGIYVVASVGIIIALLNHDIVPFNMDVTSVGPFVNGQLIVVFIINLICFAIEWIRAGLAEQDVHAGIYIIVLNIFLTMVYSDLLHRMSSPQDFYRIFILDTAVIVAETMILFGLMLLVKRVLPFLLDVVFLYHDCYTGK
ncbi:MAG: helix-turn-helix domain-containing protein [Lachnospiraceae bacterium]